MHGALHRALHGGQSSARSSVRSSAKALQKLYRKLLKALLKALPKALQQLCLPSVLTTQCVVSPLKPLLDWLQSVSGRRRRSLNAACWPHCRDRCSRYFPNCSLHLCCAGAAQFFAALLVRPCRPTKPILQNP